MKKIKDDTYEAILTAGLLSIFLIFFLVVVFDSSRPLTDKNTYVESEKIIDIEIKLNHHRGDDTLYLTSEDNKYKLVTGWQDEEQTYALAERILSEDREYTIIVRKYLTMGLSDVVRGGFTVNQIVDMRTDTDIIWDINNHINEYKFARLFFLMMAVLSLPMIIFMLQGIWILWPRKKKKKKRKKKVKKNNKLLPKDGEKQ